MMIFSFLRLKPEALLPIPKPGKPSADDVTAVASNTGIADIALGCGPDLVGPINFEARGKAGYLHAQEIFSCDIRAGNTIRGHYSIPRTAEAT